MGTTSNPYSHYGALPFFVRHCKKAAPSTTHASLRGLTFSASHCEAQRAVAISTSNPFPLFIYPNKLGVISPSFKRHPSNRCRWRCHSRDLPTPSTSPTSCVPLPRGARRAKRAEWAFFDLRALCYRIGAPSTHQYKKAPKRGTSKNKLCSLKITLITRHS